MIFTLVSDDEMTTLVSALVEQVIVDLQLTTAKKQTRMSRILLRAIFITAK